MANTLHPTTKYAVDAVAGKIKGIGELEMLAYKRHLADLKKSKNPKYPYVFDESRADRFMSYYEKCVDPETGKTYEALPHMWFDYGALMGWVMRDTGERRFGVAYKEEARGGVKTTGCAVVALYFLTSDKLYPPGNPDEGYIINTPIIQCMAVDGKQVDELLNPIKYIARATPQLRTRVDAKETYVRGTRTNGEVRVLSKETKNKQGGKPNLVIVDELADHTNSKRLNTVRGGLGKKAQGLLYMITTAGDDAKNNPAKKERDYSVNVLTGKIEDERYFAIIRELDENDDIHDKANWLKANAMYRYKTPYSKRLLSQVTDDYKRAFNGKVIDYDLQHEFITRRLNRWDVATVNKWLDSEMLKRLRRLVVPKAEFEKLTAGLPKIEGLDLSKSRDLTARGEVFRLRDGRIGINAVGYIPVNSVETHERSDGVPYRAHIKQGDVRISGDEYIDLTQVGLEMVEEETVREQNIVEITYDPYKAYQLAMELAKGERFGPKKYLTVEIPQTMVHLHIPTQLLYDSILDGNLVVCENDCLLRHFENCYKQKSKTGDLVKISKRDKDSTDRIDMVAAIINGLARIESLNVCTLGDRIIENGGYNL